MGTRKKVEFSSPLFVAPGSPKIQSYLEFMLIFLRIPTSPEVKRDSRLQKVFFFLIKFRLNSMKLPVYCLIVL